MSEEILSPAALLAAALLREAREESIPPDLSFARPVMVRSPWLWVIAFEELDIRSEALSTDHGVRGPMGDIFRKCAERVFCGRDSPPFVAPASMTEDLELLTSNFVSLGMLYERIPLPQGEDVKRMITQIITILRPVVEQAEIVLRRLNATFIAAMGGNAERFLVARHLDPGLFGAGDREALRKATVRPEGFLDGSRDHRQRDRRPEAVKKCSRCGGNFTGRFREHFRSCPRAKNARRGEQEV
jgi:hypothetical protein